MSKLSKTARAKINLALHITGQRGDGYHLLSSLVVFANEGDTVTIGRRDDNQSTHRLSIIGPFSKGLDADDNNLVMKAAQAMGEPLPPLDIVLEKRLPVASGIGGGSADAAATLLAISELFDRPLPDRSTLLSLGADVPVCLHGCHKGGGVLMTGIGEGIEPLPPLPLLHIVLVNPKISVSTPAIFKRLNNKENAPIMIPDSGFDDQNHFIAWLETQRNDLEAPAIAECPLIRGCLDALGACTGVLMARMSGSGATCFGLFDTALEARNAADGLAQKNPQWWVTTSTLV